VATTRHVSSGHHLWHGDP